MRFEQLIIKFGYEFKSIIFYVCVPVCCPGRLCTRCRDHHEMYEYFKKVGPEIRKKFINNEITDKEFQDWIDSTKVRKK